MAIVDTAKLAQRNADLVHIDANRDNYHPRFRDWFLTNHEMWLNFESASDAVRARGFTNYSAYVIVNVLRWRANIRGTNFSMSNTLIPDLARLYNATRGPLFATAKRFGKETS